MLIQKQIFKNVFSIMDNDEYHLSKDAYDSGNYYTLIHRSGGKVLSVYMLQFIIQIDGTRFAIGSGTNYKNKKRFSIINYDKLTGNAEKEFECVYYGKDNDDYKTILERVKNIFHKDTFILQGEKEINIFFTDRKKYEIPFNQRQTITYDTNDPTIPEEDKESFEDLRAYMEEVDRKGFIRIKNVNVSFQAESVEDESTVKFIAKSKYNPDEIDEVEFVVRGRGLPITGFYSRRQDVLFYLLPRKAVANILKKDINEVTYSDVLSATLKEKILKPLNFSDTYSNMNSSDELAAVSAKM